MRVCRPWLSSCACSGGEIMRMSCGSGGGVRILLSFFVVLRFRLGVGVYTLWSGFATESRKPRRLDLPFCFAYLFLFFLVSFYVYKDGR
ncbi:hypothetical protein BZA70DRAFT_281237 [Myxozyma melibiosi]|uniref:Uncharacterized protein n=1 Tax=Myxozyma melibiosi TaxID=54550 RepID=A0ABR1F2E3_9ASCO